MNDVWPPVTVQPGTYFPGDMVVYMNEPRFRLANFGLALRLYVQNEERRMAYMSHWEQPPCDHVLNYLRETIQAPTLLELPDINRRYNVRA